MYVGDLTVMPQDVTHNQPHPKMTSFHVSNLPCFTRSLSFYLETPQEHTVYKAEGVGLIMGFHLLHGLTHQLTHPTILGTDKPSSRQGIKQPVLPFRSLPS